MLGLKDLKGKNNIRKGYVECPVIGCKIRLARQRNHFQRNNIYKCPIHNIFVSATTFEYEREDDNLLWVGKNDLNLLRQIRTVKRESRIARDNSEDAVTWNVFRYLEKNNLICNLLWSEIGIKDNIADIIYWGFYQTQRCLWNKLRDARKEFEPKPSRGSEPDLIILGDKTLTIIEAKFGATNNTSPGKTSVGSKYMSGGSSWWQKVFVSDFNSVIQCKKYELSRFWLLGTWIADKLNLDFRLIVLTLQKQDKNIENIFNPHIKYSLSRKFQRITWENIYNYIKKYAYAGKDKQSIEQYFNNKSRGYDGKGNIQKAFF